MQIAERKELVSSIKRSMFNPEKSDSLKLKNPFSSLEVSEEDDVKGVVDREFDNGTSQDKFDLSASVADQIYSSGSDVVREESRTHIQHKSFTEQANLEGEFGETSLTSENGFAQEPGKVEDDSPFSVKADLSQPREHMPTSEPAVLPRFLTESINDYEAKVDDVSKSDGSDNSMDDNIEEPKMFSEEEVVKPPPLAGANVMNVILVAAECAPWSKTGIIN